MSKAFKKFDLTGKTAFVTGGGTGLGYCMARGLALSGAKVMIAARREDVLKDAAARLTEEAEGNEVLYTPIDLKDNVALGKTAQDVVAQLGGVDIFVGNAGGEGKAMVWEDQEDVLANLIQVNFAANVTLVKHFVPHMKEKQWGRVIFSSSESSIRGVAGGQSMYGASKGALNSYTKMAAMELGHDGITVNSLIIGFFLTDMMKTNVIERMDQLKGPGAGAAMAKDFASNTALGRLGDPAEIEGLVQLLASDAGSFITGSEVLIDGGTSIMMRPKPVQ